jgi:hypothetical protein
MGLIAGFIALIVSLVMAPFAIKRKRGKKESPNVPNYYKPSDRPSTIAEHRRY